MRTGAQCVLVGYANWLLKNMFTKHSEFVVKVVNQKLEQFDEKRTFFFFFSFFVTK